MSHDMVWISVWELSLGGGHAEVVEPLRDGI
jgi:hypothetical protein